MSQVQDEAKPDLKHDLSVILGSLNAIEFLMFSPADPKQESIRKSYRTILNKIEGLLADVSLPSKNVSKETGPV
jgi:hypothetical protein